MKTFYWYYNKGIWNFVGSSIVGILLKQKINNTKYLIAKRVIKDITND
jgi:hypothetical protein